MARTHARTGGRPYPRKPKWSFGPLAPVEKAVREWCRLRGLDPDAKGVRSDAINSLILAGAKARPMGVEVTVELRRLSLADLDAKPATATEDGPS